MYLKDINEYREKIKTIKEQMDAIANSAKNILEQYKDSKANPGQENIVEEAKTILAKLNQSNRWIKAATTLADGAGNLTEETFLEKKTEYSAQIKQLAAFQRDFDRYIIQNKKRLENHTYSPTSREGLATRFAELKNKVEKISEAKASKETEELLKKNENLNQLLEERNQAAKNIKLLYQALEKKLMNLSNESVKQQIIGQQIDLLEMAYDDYQKRSDNFNETLQKQLKEEKKLNEAHQTLETTMGDLRKFAKDHPEYQKEVTQYLEKLQKKIDEADKIHSVTSHAVAFFHRENDALFNLFQDKLTDFQQKMKEASAEIDRLAEQQTKKIAALNDKVAENLSILENDYQIKHLEKTNKLLKGQDELIHQAKQAATLQEINNIQKKLKEISETLESTDKNIDTKINKNLFSNLNKQRDKLIKQKEDYAKLFKDYPDLMKELKKIQIPKIANFATREELNKFQEALNTVDRTFEYLFAEYQKEVHIDNQVKNLFDPETTFASLVDHLNQENAGVILKRANATNSETLKKIINAIPLKDLNQEALSEIKQYASGGKSEQINFLLWTHETNQAALREYADDQNKVQAALFLHRTLHSNAELISRILNNDQQDIILSLKKQFSSSIYTDETSQKQFTDIIASEPKILAAKAILDLNQFKGDFKYEGTNIDELIKNSLTNIAVNENLAQAIFNIKDNQSLFNPIFIQVLQQDDYPEYTQPLQTLLASKQSDKYQAVLSVLVNNMKNSVSPLAILMNLNNPHRGWIKTLGEFPPDKLDSLSSMVHRIDSTVEDDDQKRKILAKLGNYSAADLDKLSTLYAKIDKAFKAQIDNAGNDDKLKTLLESTQTNCLTQLVSGKTINEGFNNAEKVIDKQLGQSKWDAVYTFFKNLFNNLGRLFNFKSSIDEQKTFSKQTAQSYLKDSLKQLRKEDKEQHIENIAVQEPNSHIPESTQTIQLAEGEHLEENLNENDVGQESEQTTLTEAKKNEAHENRDSLQVPMEEIDKNKEVNLEPQKDILLQSIQQKEKETNKLIKLLSANQETYQNYLKEEDKKTFDERLSTLQNSSHQIGPHSEENSLKQLQDTEQKLTELVQNLKELKGNIIQALYNTAEARTQGINQRIAEQRDTYKKDIGVQEFNLPKPSNELKEIIKYHQKLGMADNEQLKKLEEFTAKYHMMESKLSETQKEAAKLILKQSDPVTETTIQLMNAAIEDKNYAQAIVNIKNNINLYDPDILLAMQLDKVDPEYKGLYAEKCQKLKNLLANNNPDIQNILSKFMENINQEERLSPSQILFRISPTLNNLNSYPKDQLADLSQAYSKINAAFNESSEHVLRNQRDICLSELISNQPLNKGIEAVANAIQKFELTDNKTFKTLLSELKPEIPRQQQDIKEKLSALKNQEENLGQSSTLSPLKNTGGG